MGESFGKVTRMSAIIAVLLALIMLATPVLQLGSKTVDVSPVTSVQAASGRTFTVGQVDYGGGMATLNPFIYTQAEEMETIWPCYSTLLTYDINSNIIGDLANSWTVSPDGMTWDFKIAHNAYFIDPTQPTVKDPARLVTYKDIWWTFWEVNNDTGNHLGSYFTNGKISIIQSIRQGADQFEIIVTTTQPYAPFLGALTMIPIVPEYIWNHFTGGTKVLSYSNLPMVGSGPFYSTMTAVPQTVGTLLRNPIWFQEENRGWQLHIDTLNYKTELNAVTAWAELTTSPPTIDTMIGITPSQYTGNFVPPATPPQYLMGFAQSTGFVFEYQLNQMSTLERTQLERSGGVQHGGTNNQLLLNPTVKLALAMSVDKQTFIDQAYGGLGMPADSLVPNVNRWHYTYPNPVQFDPGAARTLLMNAGWRYDSTGADATSTTCPLYKKGPINNTLYHPLSFRLLSLTPETWWDTGSRLIVDWARQAGVEYTRSLVSTNMANGAWYKGDYDAWLWDWMFTPTSDPSTDCLSVDITSQIGVWSGSYWSNVTFDKLYNDSLTAVDEGARRVITDKMQALLYEDHADQLVAWRKELYAVNYQTWNQASYGDWAAHYLLMPDQAAPYLYMQLYPNNNHAPTVTGLSPTLGPYYVNSTQTFVAGADDASALKYQFFWGDGTNSSWQDPTFVFTHKYTHDGVYTVYFAARETGPAPGAGQPDDRYMSWGQTKVTIIDPDNSPPSSVAIAKSPGSGINSGTLVTFTGSATDTDPLYYTWSFGDSIGGVGQVATHQFKTPGDYTVYLNVTDNHPGTGRPAQSTMGMHITANGLPQVSLPSTRLVQFKQSYTYTATATDPDGDLLRYTWNWGDGSRDVTTVPTATHTYAQKNPGVNLMLYTDDLTTLSGHNVTQLEVVTVVGNPTPPTITTWTVNNVTTPVTALAGKNLWFIGAAKDTGGADESLTFQFKLGDGIWYNVTSPPPGGPSTIVTFSFPHPYLTAGTYTAYLYVYDGQDITQSSGIIITITVNHPPTIVTPPVNKLGDVNVAVSVSVTAFDSDAGTVLKYTWDFGDGTVVVAPSSTSHVYTTAGNRTYAVYVDDQSGLVGHNVSRSATASIAFSLNLVAGWNFISVPLVGYGYKASTLGLADGAMVAGWNSTRQVYDQTYIVGISEPTDDFAITASTGYWVWIGAAQTLHLYGSAPATLQMKTFVVPLIGGWVAVGFESQNTTRHASDIIAMYSPAGAIEMIADYTVSGYSVYFAFDPGYNDFLLVPGRAYWCWTTGSGTLSYMP